MDQSHHPNRRPRSGSMTVLPTVVEASPSQGVLKAPSLVVSRKKTREVRMTAMEVTLLYTKIELKLAPPPRLVVLEVHPNQRPLVYHRSLHPGQVEDGPPAMSATTHPKAESNPCAGPTRPNMPQPSRSVQTLTLPVSETLAARRRRASSPRSPRCSRAAPATNGTSNGQAEIHLVQSTRARKVDGQQGLIKTSNVPGQLTDVVAVMIPATMTIKATSYRFQTTGTRIRSR